MTQAMDTLDSTDGTLRQEIVELRAKLKESEETLRAITSGEVDAIIMNTPSGEQLFSLKGAEQPYREMVENMSEGAVTATPAGMVVYCNQRFADMIKADLRTIMGSSLLEHFADPDGARIAASLRESQTGTARFSANFLASDATRVPVNVSMHVQADSGGQRIAIVISDLTEVVAAQETTMRLNLELERRLAEIRISETRYRSLVDTMNDGLIETDEAPTLTYVNPRFAEMLGYGVADLVGRPSFTLMPCEVIEQMRQRLAERKAGHSEVYESCWLHRDGHEVPTRISSRPRFGPDGRYFGTTINVTDLTDQKRAEAAKEKTARARRMLNTCSNIIIHTVDETRLLTDVCEAMTRLGDYRLAWVGYAEHDAAKSVRPAAWADGHGDYVANAKVSWDAKSERGRGPTGIAIRTDEAVVARDTEADPVFQPWRAMAHESGYRSTTAIPLRSDDGVFGALMVYSGEPDAFDNDEVLLLSDLADDLAFGVMALRNKQARDHLAAIVESANDAIVGRDLDGTITSWNRGAERLFGYQAAEIVGRPMRTLLPREIAGESDWLVDRLRDGETVEQFDSTRITRDGHRIAVSLTDSPIRDAAGEMIGAAVLMRDNTARKNAEAALQFRERTLQVETEKLHSILDSMAEAVIVADRNGKIIEANRAALVAQGTTVPSDTVEAWMANVQLLLPDRAAFLPSDLNPLLRAVGGDATDDLDVYLRRPDGTGVDAQMTGRPILDQDGAVTGGVVVFSDITERKKSEADLRSASSYARSLIEASLDPMVMIDTDGKITDVNKATEVATCQPRDRLIGDDFSNYFTEPEMARAAYRRAFAEGFVTDYPLTIRNAAHTKDVLYNASTYCDEKGRVLGVFAAARDITKLKAAEEELTRYQRHLEDTVAERTAALEQTNQALDSANHELESFAYSVSHDLRAPLRAIDGFSCMLQEDYADRLDAEGSRLLQVVRDGAEKMTRLIDDILAYSRLGRHELAASAIDMTALARATWNDLTPATTGRAIEVKIALLPSTRGDREMMQRVWQNLLDNAIKFTARKASALVEVGSYPDGDSTVYFVKDNGAGFDMQYVGRLFGVFQRLHGQKDFPGTGAGLAIVQRIVSRHGGRVWAEGKVGEGATFYFALPAMADRNE